VKLALIVPGGFHPGGRDNVIPALVSLAEELARRHTVHVFAFGGPGPVTHDLIGGAEVHQLGDPATIDPPRRARTLRLLARLARQLAGELADADRARPFQILHAFWANEPGLLAGALGRCTGRPVVVSVGGGEAARLPDIGYGGARSLAGRGTLDLSLRLARAVTVGSQFARTFLPGWAAARATVVPLGIDGSRFAASPGGRPVGPPWRLLHVGSLNPVKDHRTLLHAVARVVADGTDVTLDCIGEDTLGGRVQSEARALGLGERVRFHGHLPNPELAPFYRNAHLQVVSSRYESQSVAVLEAASAGLPTVGTAVGLLATMAPAAAAVVAPGDAEGLAHAIERLLDHGLERRAMAEAAQAFGRAHDVASTARAFERIYADLGAGPS
jgi:glycosyltransferase involved in cell wall biosynthesis